MNTILKERRVYKKVCVCIRERKRESYIFCLLLIKFSLVISSCVCLFVCLFIYSDL